MANFFSNAANFIKKAVPVVASVASHAAPGGFNPLLSGIAGGKQAIINDALNAAKTASTVLPGGKWVSAAAEYVRETQGAAPPPAEAEVIPASTTQKGDAAIPARNPAAGAFVDMPLDKRYVVFGGVALVALLVVALIARRR